MSEEITLQNCPENNPLRVDEINTQLVCDLRVKGSEVYLPQTDPVDFKSEEYEKLFLGALPDDIASEVSSVIKTKRGHFTVLNLIVIFLFLGVLSCVFYYFYPKIVFSPDEGDPSEKGLTISEKYKAITFKAKEEIEKKQWKAAITTLGDHPKDISMNEKETLDNLLIFRVYFNAVNNYVDVPSAKKAEAKNIIDQVRMHSPDRLGWYLDWLRLNFPEECNYLSNGRFEPNAERAETIKTLLPNVNPDRWKKAPDYEENNVRLLDLYYARLNFIYWCYCNPKKNLDEKDLGVFEREVAYGICKKYTNDNESIDPVFLQLRIDIIQTIMRAGTGVLEWHYFFDGESRWLASYLQKELNELNTYKKVLEEQK